MLLELTRKIDEWSVGLDYRDDLYRALKTVADKKPKLGAEEQRLVDDQMLTYRRAGLALPAAERATVEKLRKELAGLNTQFGVNITRIKPGSASALRHWHEQEDELIYMLEGELTLLSVRGVYARH